MKETQLLFLDHPDWAQLRDIDIDKQFAYWYSDQIKKIKTQHKQFKISQSDGDIIFGVEKIHTL